MSDTASTPTTPDTSLESAGGGQFQPAWAETPEGQDYIARHDEREKKYEEEQKFVDESVARQLVSPVNDSFVESPEEDAELEPTELDGTDPLAESGTDEQELDETDVPLEDPTEPEYVAPDAENESSGSGSGKNKR